MPEGSDAGQVLKEVLPRKGLLYQEDSSPLALCRPKLMPLKSVTLEKLEAMQKAAQEKGRQQQEEQLERQATAPANGSRIFWYATAISYFYFFFFFHSFFTSSQKIVLHWFSLFVWRFFLVL